MSGCLVPGAGAGGDVGLSLWCAGGRVWHAAANAVCCHDREMCRIWCWKPQADGVGVVLSSSWFPEAFLLFVHGGEPVVVLPVSDGVVSIPC